MLTQTDCPVNHLVHDLSVAQLTTLAAQGARFAFGRGKRPMGRDWQRRPHALASALRAFERGENVGVLAGRHSGGIVALDLDAGADRVRNHPIFGRTRLVWRDDAPERVKALVKLTDRVPRSRKFHDAAVEVIASGGYAVVAGVHPSGAAVRMNDAPVIGVTFDELTAAVFAWTGERLDAAGVSCARERASAGDLLDAAIVAGQAGARNAAGFDLARRLRDIGYSENDAAGVMLSYQSAVAQRGDHDYTEREALSSLTSAFRKRARRSHIDAILDALEESIVSGALRLPANLRKTAVAVVAVMRACGKIDHVALSLKTLFERVSLDRSTISRHLRDLVDRFDVLTLTSKSDFVHASTYSLSDQARGCAKLQQSSAQGTPAGTVATLHTADLRAVMDAFSSLQLHPLSEPGARVHVQLAESDAQAALTFGASAQAILSALAGGAVESVTALASAVKLSRRTVYYRVAALVEAGLVIADAGGYTLAPAWQERANALAPALTTFGRRELRGLKAARDAMLQHSYMLKFSHSERRRVAENAFERAQRDAHFWAVQVAERQRERLAAGLALGLAAENVPAISLTYLRREKRVRQPVKTAGRTVIPTAAHTGRNAQSKREQLDALLKKGTLLADEAQRARALAGDLGVDIALRVVELN